MFQELIKKIVNKVKPPCPMDGYAGPVEYLQFRSMRDRETVTMETPRGCLEFMEIKEYVSDKGQPLGDKHRWISSEERVKILAHHHTIKIAA
jgi:hypothetical protein